MMQKRKNVENKLYCFLNHKANIGDIIFSSDHNLFKVINIYENKNTVLCLPLMANHNLIHVNSYRVIGKATLVNKKVINKYDTFLIPDPPYPFDLVYFAEFKDYSGRYKCNDGIKDIWGIDEDIILSSLCTYTKELSDLDVLEIKSILSEW